MAWAAAAAVMCTAPARRCSASELDLQLPVLDTTYHAVRHPGLGRDPAAASGLGRVRAGDAVRPRDVQPGQGHAGPQEHARRLRPSSTRPARPTCSSRAGCCMVLEALHRRVHRLLLRLPRAPWAPARSPLILMWSVVGILGSYSVAWFGIRMNTYANSRTAFASLQRQAAPGLRDSAPGRHEHRRAADLRRADHDAGDPAVRAARGGGRLVPGLRDRRVARRLGARVSRAASSPRSPTSARTS